VTAVLVGDASVETLDAHCRSVLAGYKVPRRYEFVEQLPRSPAGKPLRLMIRDELSKH
jgi:long-chain acyl-CoA synthetase